MFLFIIFIEEVDKRILKFLGVDDQKFMATPGIVKIVTMKNLINKQVAV